MPYTLRNPRSTSFYSGGLSAGVKWLLISNCIIFVLYYFAVRNGFGFLFEGLGLRAQDVLDLQRPAVWQLFTYMFLHDPLGFTHILFNMLMLWMIGSDLERDWGTKRFLQYYFLCGVGAGLCVVAANVLFGSLDTRTIGSSGALYGILLAYGVLYADRIVLFAFLFPMKAKYMVMIFGAIAFLGSFGPSGGGVSYVAHLGGMIFGLIYLKRSRLGFNVLAPLARRYHSWKLRRAKRRFEVYRRKHESGNRDRWIH
jgi:membrane associated rhomboid family serine protease